MWLATRGLGSGGTGPLVTRGLSSGAAPPPSSAGLVTAILERLAGSDALAALCSARFEPHDVPQGSNDEPSLPCIVYRVLTDVHDHNLDGAAGIARAEVEFSARSRVFADCEAISAVLRGLFDGYRGTTAGVRFAFSKQMDGASDYEPNDDGSDLGTHHDNTPYKFTYIESIPIFP